ncbi:unnamed protein product [Notodromas monacha]|uniref:Guanylate cyclase domain-containing protein n=1 Tax=Notodromas monacha TaxID=399045 RepID=A0A7R9BDW1_9CRUS|nr:unnamed protein product [Notodromas monacha]CAG0913586.1 unnamed protein product [Notodromas monacha]
MLQNQFNENYVRSFIEKPVLRRLDGRLSLTFMSELRRVETIFVSLSVTQEQLPGIDDGVDALIDISLEIVARIVDELEGSVNKMFSTTTGLCFMCLFGLHGCRRKDEVSHALEAAARIWRELSMLLVDHERISVGITSGVCYCGVVGHRQRQEYTVIGAKVNMAARLMANYPGVVSCDEESMTLAMHGHDSFKLLPAKRLRGVAHPGRIFQFNPTFTLGPQTGNLPKFLFPIVNRTAILEATQRSIAELIDYAGKLSCQIKYPRSKMLEEPYEPLLHVIEGQHGTGKTRIIESIVRRAFEMGCISVGFSARRPTSSFSGARYLIEAITGLSSTIHQQARNDVIVSLLGIVPDSPEPAAAQRTRINDERQQLQENEVSTAIQSTSTVSAAAVNGYADSLWVLNEVLGLRFPVKMATWAHDVARRQDRALQLLIEIFAKLYALVRSADRSPQPFFLPVIDKMNAVAKRAPKGVVIGIDDALLLDDMSLRFISAVYERELPVPILAVFSVSPLGFGSSSGSQPDEIPAGLQRLFSVMGSRTLDDRVTLHTLGPLGKRDLVTVACQLLRARAISTGLLDLLRKVSGGNGAICELVLKQLLAHKSLNFVSIHESNVEDLDFGDASKLQPVFQGIHEGFTISPVENITLAPMPSPMNSLDRQFFASPTSTFNVIQQALSLDRVVVARETLALEVFEPPDSIQSLTELSLDFVSPVQLHYLKCAAVIGSSFNLGLLFRILPGMSRASFVRTTRELVIHGYLECLREVHPSDPIVTSADLDAVVEITEHLSATRELVIHGYLECLREVHPSDPIVTSADLDAVVEITEHLSGKHFMEDSSPEANRQLLQDLCPKRRIRQIHAHLEVTKASNIRKNCCVEANPETLETTLPCKALRFSSPLTRRVILNAMMSLQKREIHSIVADVLSQFPPYCLACNGTSFTTGASLVSTEAVDVRVTENSTAISSRLGLSPILTRDLDPPTVSWLTDETDKSFDYYPGSLGPRRKSSQESSNNVRARASFVEALRTTFAASGVVRNEDDTRRTDPSRLHRHEDPGFFTRKATDLDYDDLTDFEPIFDIGANPDANEDVLSARGRELAFTSHWDDIQRRRLSPEITGFPLGEPNDDPLQSFHASAEADYNKLEQNFKRSTSIRETAQERNKRINSENRSTRTPKVDKGDEVQGDPTSVGLWDSLTGFVGKFVGFSSGQEDPETEDSSIFFNVLEYGAKMKAHLALLNTAVNLAANGLLNDAETLSADLKADTPFLESMENDPEFGIYCTLVKARTMRLRAFISKAYGETDSAIKWLKSALEELNYSFPKDDIRKHWHALTNLQTSIMRHSENYQGVVLASDTNRAWLLLEASYCLIALVACLRKIDDDAIYAIGVAALMSIHAMEAAPCHFAHLVVGYALCLETCCWLPAKPSFLKHLVQHSLALISRKTNFSVEELVHVDHYITAILQLVSTKGTLQEANDLSMTYYPVNAGLPLDNSYVSLFRLLAVVPFTRSLDIQGLKLGMGLLKANVQAIPSFDPLRIDYILMCMLTLLDIVLLLECQLTDLVNLYEAKEWSKFQEHLANAQDHLKEIQRRLEKSGIGAARLFMLEAYLEKIRGRHRESSAALKRSLQVAAEKGARRPFFRAKFNDMAWHGELSDRAMNAWSERAAQYETDETFSSALEDESSHRYALHPLPIPKALIIPRNVPNSSKMSNK